MPTLAPPPRRNDDCRALARAAADAGWGVWAAEGWRIPPGTALDAPVVYADPLFADVAAAHFGLALLDPPPDLLPRLPDAFRGRRVELTTLAEARGRSGPAFFKPADEKCFPAQVYGSGAELPTIEELPAELPVLVSEPVQWQVEYRCFVLDGAVATFSPYLRDGELAQAEDGSWPAPAEEAEAAGRFAKEVLDGLGREMPAAFVLDVGIMGPLPTWAVVKRTPRGVPASTAVIRPPSSPSFTVLSGRGTPFRPPTRFLRVPLSPLSERSRPHASRRNVYDRR